MCVIRTRFFRVEESFSIYIIRDEIVEANQHSHRGSHLLLGRCSEVHPSAAMNLRVRNYPAGPEMISGSILEAL